MRRITIALLVIVTLTLPATAQETKETDPKPNIYEQLHTEAEALRAMVHTDVARCFLAAVQHLPEIETRTIHYNPETKQALRADRTGHLTDDQLDSWNTYEFDARFYYTTWFGTPLAFTRPLDLVAQHMNIETIDGLRFADVGYGNIGQLRLLASNGAHCTGIDVNTRLHELYSLPGDTGSIERIGGNGSPGSITLVCGQWPASDDIIEHVSDGYDIFISKNTLKRGYINPERDVDPRMLVHLGVDDETYVAHVWRVLKPGGVAMIYNICPKRSAPDDEQYKPWSDGRCPFDRELLEKQGFEIIEYNRDDTEFVRDMARAFGWDEQMDVEGDLFAEYTLLRRPAATSTDDQ